MKSEGPQDETALIRVASWMVAGLLRAIGLTWRITVEGTDPREQSSSSQIGALCHRDILLAGFFFRDSGISVPVSRSRDGALAAAILHRLGFAQSPRGSSSKGGSSALLELIKRVTGGDIAAIIVDGPRGPASVAKPGVVYLAAHTRVPITPVSFSARPCLRLQSWDRTMIPLPFARVTCRFGTPVQPVAEEADDAQARESSRAALETQLQNATRELDREISRKA